MLVTDLFLKPASGFIAISPGLADPGSVAKHRVASPADHVQDRTSIESGAVAAPGWAADVAERRTWEAPAGSSVRRVEAALLACGCVYFAFGLGGVLGLF